MFARLASPLGLLLLLLLPGALSAPFTSIAHACGGFWCSIDEPVNQTAERIVFVTNEDTTSVLIEIQYRGPSSKFAWVIPMPGKPEVTIASTRALDRLDEETRPEYRLERHVQGTCQVDDYGPGHSVDAGGLANDEDAGEEGPAGIMVLDRGTVGPYEYTTISLDPSLAQPAQTAIMWLASNGYDLTGVDAKVLGPYLADGLNLLAFKLTKAAQQNSGSLRPIVLSYEGDTPMIPIRPTAVAAEPDMGVLVWAVAEARAVPENYKSLILNEALIDWFNPQGSYRDVVTRAADEAGGQGFATELAGPGASAAEAVYTKAEAAQLRSIEDEVYDHPLDALWAASGLYRSWEGWRDAVAASVELPGGVSLDEFARDPDAYRDSVEIDRGKFFAALHEHVIDPVVETQRLLAARPYLTRLFTTMSKHEMTIDPVFTFNPDLPELSNVHVAQQYIACNPDVTESEAAWRIVLPLGDVVRGAGRSWPLDATMVPASRAIEQLSRAGQGTVLVDNTKKIEGVLDELETPHVGGGKQEASRVGRQDEDCAVYRPGVTGGLRGAAWLIGLSTVLLGARRGRGKRRAR